MDKSLMRLRRILVEYQLGLEGILDFAFSNFKDKKQIQCPCKKCMGLLWKARVVVKDYIIIYGLKSNYEVCYQHGEVEHVRRVDGHGMEQMLHVVFPSFAGHPNEASSFMPPPTNERYNAKLDGLLEDAKRPLYDGCDKMAAWEFLVKLFHGKCMFGLTNTTCNWIFDLFRDVLPKGANIPRNHYEASKLIANLGFTYNKIHACPMLGA